MTWEVVICSHCNMKTCGPRILYWMTYLLAPRAGNISATFITHQHSEPQQLKKTTFSKTGILSSLAHKILQPFRRDPSPVRIRGTGGCIRNGNSKRDSNAAVSLAHWLAWEALRLVPTFETFFGRLTISKRQVSDFRARRSMLHWG